MNRRRFFMALGVLAAGLLFPVRLFFNRTPRESFVPTSGHAKVPGRPRVVQIHHAGACDWQYGEGSYVESIDYRAVKRMIYAGLTAISGTENPAASWKKIIHPYRRGDKIVIKPNLNNTRIGYSQAIMTSPQVIQALVESLLEAGYPREDISIYDLTAHEGQAVTNRLATLGVETVFMKQDRNVLQKVAAKLNLGPSAPDTQALVRMQKPARDNDGNDIRCYMPNVLTRAQHLINVPVFKAHQFVLQSSALKNHFGTVRFSNHNSYPVVLHGVDIDSHIADINANPHIRDKTRLVVVDALFGAGCFLRGAHGRTPSRWRTLGFGDTPASLFFSQDPVAVESVLGDIIIKEQQAVGYKPYSHNYLHFAAQAGLGVHEHWDKGERYANIDLRNLSIKIADG